MEEPLSNIGLVCDKHAPKPNSELAKKPLKFFIGKFVKKAFKITTKDASFVMEQVKEAYRRRKLKVPPKKELEKFYPRTEHMWVKVTGTKDGKLVGKLNNDPLYAIHLKDGQTVQVSKNQIEDVTK